MDNPLFFNSQTCGMCIAMRGTGPGSGGITGSRDHAPNHRSLHLQLYGRLMLADILAKRSLLCFAGDPIPLTTQYVLVSNLCPECKTGDLDQEKAGDGRWKIEWHPVQCAVGSTPFVYSFQGSNPYYIKMQISNHRQV